MPAPCQFEQCGNAVCARLAMQLGRGLREAAVHGTAAGLTVCTEPEPPAGHPEAVLDWDEAAAAGAEADDLDGGGGGDA